MGRILEQDPPPPRHARPQVFAPLARQRRLLRAAVALRDVQRPPPDSGGADPQSRRQPPAGRAPGPGGGGRVAERPGADTAGSLAGHHTRGGGGGGGEVFWGETAADVKSAGVGRVWNPGGKLRRACDIGPDRLGKLCFKVVMGRRGTRRCRGEAREGPRILGVWSQWSCSLANLADCDDPVTKPLRSLPPSRNPAHAHSRRRDPGWTAAHHPRQTCI